MDANLAKIAAAVEAAGGRTPQTVLDAFAPELPIVFGRRLRPFTLGAYLALERLDHPFLTGRTPALSDVAVAVHVLSVPSENVLAAIADGSIVDAVLQTSALAGMNDLEQNVSSMRTHVESAMMAAVPMESSHSSTEPRKAGGFGWWLTVLTNACRVLHRPVAEIMHRIPLAQVLAVTACHAWGEGMDPSGETYEDREMLRLLGDTKDEDQVP